MKNILAIVFICTSLSAFTQTKTFTVSGKIKGLDSKEMSILIDDKTKNWDLKLRLMILL